MNREELEKVEMYWYVDTNGDVKCALWQNDEVDNFRKDFGRIFETKKECKRYLKIQKAFKEESKKFKPNWNDKCQCKYYIRYNCIYDKLLIDFSFSTKGYCDYFESKEVLQKLISYFGRNDVKKYYLGIED